MGAGATSYMAELVVCGKIGSNAVAQDAVAIAHVLKFTRHSV
jgi:hypothetical protein